MGLFINLWTPTIKFYLENRKGEIFFLLVAVFFYFQLAEEASVKRTYSVCQDMRFFFSSSII